MKFAYLTALQFTATCNYVQKIIYEMLIKLTLPITLNTKASIIKYFAEHLSFPAYWQVNWDSFFDCMRDVQEEHVMIEIRCLYHVTPSPDLMMLKSILDELNEEQNNIRFTFETVPITPQ